jgi:hypothetical protein
MKKLAATSLSLFLALSPSLAKTTAAKKDSVYQKHSVLKTPTQTRNVLARAVPRAQRRLLVSNDLIDDDELPGPNELDLHRAWRRPELVKNNPIDSDNQDDEISDYIKTRLLIARVRALQKYQETWG